MTKNNNPKLKLLFYLPGLVDGGAERVMVNLANWFAQQGYSVSLIVDFASNQNHPPLDPGVEVRQLSQKHLSSIQQLAKVLIEDHPDIAVSAIASANFKLVVASLLARAKNLSKRRAPKTEPQLVLTYHGFEEYKTGKLSWLGYQNLSLMSRHAGAVIAVSDCLKDELLNRWKARADKLLRIYNPVSIPPLPADAKPIAPKDRENIILSVGRLVADKRFNLLIKAFARLKGTSTRLIIAGEGPERQNLEHLIEQLDLSERVELPGYVDNTGSLYGRAKCFALMSKTESFGLVLVEALAYGLPIIATDCGGPREILDHGRYGVLLNNKPTLDDIEQALNKALDNTGDAAPRIERAKDFAMQAGAHQYANLFKRLHLQSK